jgi:hypothetical protein
MRRARHRGAAHPPIWGHIVGKRSGGPTSHANLLCRARVWLVQQGVRPRRAFPLPSSERGSAIEAPIMLRPRNVAASRAVRVAGSVPGAAPLHCCSCGTRAGDGGGAVRAATSLHRALRLRSRCAVAVAGEVAWQPADAGQRRYRAADSSSSRNSRGRSAPPDARAAGRRWRPGRE